MEALLVVFVCLGLAYLASEIFQKFGLPRVLGQMLIGIVIGIPVVSNLFFTQSDFRIISFMADIGLILLLFFVGLKIDIKSFITLGRRSAYVSIFGFLFPFLIGFGLAKFVGFNNIIAAVIGLTLSVSAEAVAIEILQDLGKLKTTVGEIIIEAGVIDDAIAVIILSVIIAFLEASGNIAIGLGKIFGNVLIFALVIFVARFFILPRIWKHIENEHSQVNEFTAALLIGLLIAIIAKLLGLSAIIGAIIAGIVVRQVLIHGTRKGLLEERKITRFIEVITFGFIAPFFFIWIGIKTNLSIMFAFPLFGLLVVFIGFGGKIFGCLFGNYLGKGSFREGNLIAWAMNTRGAVELVVIEIARSKSLISTEVFSALVFMAFVSTMVSPVVFQWLCRKHKRHIKKK